MDIKKLTEKLKQDSKTRTKLDRYKNLRSAGILDSDGYLSSELFSPETVAQDKSKRGEPLLSDKNIKDIKVGDKVWVWVDSYFPFAKVRVIGIQDTQSSNYPLYNIEYLSDLDRVLHSDDTWMWRDELYENVEDLWSKVKAKLYKDYPEEEGKLD